MNIKQLRFVEVCLVFLSKNKHYERKSDLSNLNIVFEYKNNIFTASTFFKVNENFYYSDTGLEAFGQSFEEKDRLWIDSDVIGAFLPTKTVKTFSNSTDSSVVQYELLKFFVEKEVPELELSQIGNYLFNVENLSTGLKLPIMAVPEEAEFNLISIN